ncbi:hypothetical protein EVAR_41302_1 [Eumeta japonica]|uniref:Uncharacterized protein n=1 Tax=Eumeta variegata TaxID=151549 RepID=A0A4C1XAC3_EUMVA|nr:hypothetical protein EVAR_41302_1 [Eumeta japonica]
MEKWKKSEIISRDPEIISTPLNVEISQKQVIVPVEQEAFCPEPLLQQFLLLVVFCQHHEIPKMKMQSHQEQLDVQVPSSRQDVVDDLHKFK